MNFAPTPAQQRLADALHENWGQRPRRRGYHPDDILEKLIAFHERHDRWPTLTTEFRRDPQLPHNQTVASHFGSIERAIELAQVRLER